MTTMKLSWIAGALAFGAVLAVPQAASGQLNTFELAAHANHLHDVAVNAGQGYVSDFATIAEKHRAAAEMRLISDPRAVECTQFQATVLHYSGQLEEAQAQFEHAAEIALAKDDFLGAGMSFVDAAFVAQEQGRSGDALRLANQAYRVSQLTALDRDGRDAIQRRLAPGFRGW
jgi:hypothetical protein